MNVRGGLIVTIAFFAGCDRIVLAPDPEINAAPVRSVSVAVEHAAEDEFIERLRTYASEKDFAFWITRGVPPETRTNRIVVVADGMQLIAYNPFDYEEYSLSFYRSEGSSASDTAVKAFAQEAISEVMTVRGVTAVKTDGKLGAAQ